VKTLFIIPARKGSKGVPGKNKKLLNGKPLIAYSLEYALQHSSPENICVSTDDLEIMELTKKYGIPTPFVRPDELATDTATSFDVLLHAINFYENQGKVYDTIVLLQPTSPFRKAEHLNAAISNFNGETEAVFSVCVTNSNPYYVLFEEGSEGFLQRSKEIDISRRQDAPIVYEANGSIYVISIAALKKYKSWNEFKRIAKVEMPQIYSADIDNMEDWYYCEFILERGLLS